MLRSSQRDNLLSIQTLRWKRLGVFLCPALRVLEACASAALAKNSPPDCFLHARTVLQEIIILSFTNTQAEMLGCFPLSPHCGSSRRFIKISMHTSVGANCVRPNSTITSRQQTGEHSSPLRLFDYTYYKIIAFPLRKFPRLTGEISRSDKEGVPYGRVFVMVWIQAFSLRRRC